MRDKQTAEPYQLLGQELRALRTKAKESLSETSGAVEIEIKQLLEFETGKARPNEEVLLLLISHFNPQDNQALHIWKLAGYTEKGAAAVEVESSEAPVLFTDLVEIMANQYGLTIEFKQTAGPDQPARSAAKLGMSREHAESVIRSLAIALAKTSTPESSKLLSPGADAD